MRQLIVSAAVGAVTACSTFTTEQAPAPDAAAPSGGCNAGLTVVKGTVFVPSPRGGNTCSDYNAADVDGETANLDGDGNLGTMIDGRDINGCVGVAFTPAVALQQVIVRMKAIDGACQTKCTSACGDQVFAYVFAADSAEVSNLKRIGADPMALADGDYKDHAFSTFGFATIAAAVVCRDHKTGDAPDIGVDAIYGCK